MSFILNAVFGGPGGRPNQTEKLNDKDLLLLLAKAAQDCYNLKRGDLVCDDKMKITYRQFQDEAHPANGIQFGIYEILYGEHRGRKIMAIRGSKFENDGYAAAMSAIQDVSIAIAGHAIRLAIDAAINRAREQHPDFVCGHSLGSLLAECVCSATGIPGASFNGPGPIGLIPKNNLLRGDRHNGVRFEVHLTYTDIVSNIAGFGGPGQSHIGEPIWHSGKENVVKSHQMVHLIEKFSN